MNAQARTHTHTRTRTHTYTKIFPHGLDLPTSLPWLPACLPACWRASICTPRNGPETNFPIPKNKHAYTGMDACKHACMHTWMHTNIHMQAHANTNTDRHMQAHTYRHTQAHTHPCTRTSKPCHARRNTHRTLPAPMQNELVGTRVRAFPGMPANND